MPTIRIALANVRVPAHRDESVDIVCDALQDAQSGGAAIVAFPECFVPGYRCDTSAEPPDPVWLNQSWTRIDKRAGELGIAVVLGTERLADNGLHITARVTSADGTLAGFQDKVQLDPSEEALYAAGRGRRLFRCGDLAFGVVICHEGWRYPETVRWAAERGAHVVFHPHFEVVEDENFQPTGFADPNNTFHEKAALCRAAENTCYFATINAALPGSSTTSAVIDPHGVLVVHQPHAVAGILFADIMTEEATGMLARRRRPATEAEPTS